MRTPVTAVVGLAILASPAFGQVRPQDCRPVLPVVDQAAMAVPQDVITQPAAPEVAAQKRFIGLPFLLPALVAGGGIIGALSSGGGGGNNNPPVSPG
jgi:hypothetical protein